ncbi:SPOR domain-containing protein [Thiomicrorhabdus sp. Milos-T2]|uniref:SPOR domain-containing protein n=1 Tax=Thiomicrorhabdus sp. Milos-T2 TaxID=90814 RepID=UPI000493C45B|nr:SPOR domain-containing protein [Thiomicrorhabdus sp. Milos-T2]
MSLTISELESERAKILEEIESKASKISQKAPSKENSPSLNDWLNAAEDVMPEKPERKPKANYSNQLLSSPNSNNKSSIIGVVIMLSLFLTILGVIYIAYTSIHKELQEVLAAKEESMAKIQTLESDMKNLSEVVASGGKSELFTQLENKVVALEIKVSQLQTAMKGLNSTKVSIASDSTSSTTSKDIEDSAATMALETQSSTSQNIVTEAVLDQKLKVYTQQLESKIDKKLEIILEHLKNNGDSINAVPMINSSKLKPTEKSAQIETPTVKTVNTPVIDEPLIKLVKSTTSPAAPKAPKAPVVSTSKDVNWLLQQPKMHYILQLASMPDADSLKKIVSKNQLKDTKVLPQTRNNLTNYVLVSGSFADRAKANALAKEIKTNTGITPWIRKVRDLSSRIQ